MLARALTEGPFHAVKSACHMASYAPRGAYLQDKSARSPALASRPHRLLQLTRGRSAVKGDSSCPNAPTNPPRSSAHVAMASALAWPPQVAATSSLAAAARAASASPCSAGASEPRSRHISTPRAGLIRVIPPRTMCTIIESAEESTPRRSPSLHPLLAHEPDRPPPLFARSTLQKG